jgi:hypothetical protein
VDNGGDVEVSTDPTGGAGAWVKADIDARNALAGVSCPTSDLCVAVDNSGNVVVSTGPTGGTAAWDVADADPGRVLTGVSCPTTRLCVAVDQEGNVLTSTNPGTGGATWTVVAADGPHPSGFNTVSCTGNGDLCIAGDNSGNLAVSTRPTGGGAAWRRFAIDGPTRDANEIAAVSCPSTQMCVAAASGPAGNFLFTATIPLFTATNTSPASGASAWAKTAGFYGNDPLDAIQCPTTTLCVAQDVATDMLVSTDPTGPASAWSVSALETPTHLSGGVSCPGRNLCVSVALKDVLTSTHP